MKTSADINALIPTLSKLLANMDHEIGVSHFERDEDGWCVCDEYAENYFCYEEDGWSIEVSYKCCGEWDYDPGDCMTPSSCGLRKAWGEVTEISAYHYDEITGEESTFEDKDLNELWNSLDKVLENIVKSNQ